MKKLSSILLLSFFLTSCGEESVKVEPMKKNDRELSCGDILLEINDAEFYKKQAEEKKSLGIKSIIMPLGYIDTYMDADEAVTAANSRVDYLKKIFSIRNCQRPLSTPMPQQQPLYGQDFN